MNTIISKKTFATIIAFSFALFALYLFMYGAFYDVDHVLIGGVGLVVGTFFVFTDFVSMSEKQNPLMKNLLLLVFLILWIAASWFLSYGVTQNTVRCVVFTIVFLVGLRTLARKIKKNGMKII